MLLKVENINKSYSNKQILKNISFEVKESEIVSIIGPSGAGKSTILRCINNLEKVDSGEITINGSKKYKEDVSLVFQDYNLFPHKTVIENIIESPIHVYKLNPDVIKQKAKVLLKNLGLEDKENYYPSKLSGGEKQRVAIARAIILNPKLLCLDEPTSALDPENIKELMKILLSLKEEMQISILLITHDMNFSKEISDRVIFLDNGAILNNIDLNTVNNIDILNFDSFFNDINRNKTI